MAYGTVNVPGVTPSELTAAVNEVRGERKDSVGGYIWKADTDKVYSKDAGGSFSVEHGSLADCKTDDYRGVWFRVQSSSSSAGIVAYDTKYTIDGANNYLSIGDYVIWTGSTLVHVPTYEAKASTVRNSDGQFAYHSGVDGLMSSTDKAYLTFLMQHFIAASMSGAFNSGDGTNESGLYGNVTYGRPAGSGEGDTYNMMSILDKVTNYTSQLLINENANNPFAYFRGRISGAWQRILSENDLVSHMAVAENDSDYPNWDNELRIYHVKKWAASSADLPNSSWSSDGDYLVVNIPGAPNATTLHARTQFVMNNSNMEIWCRFIPSYSGSGSLAGGSPTAWVRLSGGLGHSHSNKTELDSITSTLISNWNAAYDHIDSAEGKISDIHNILLFNIFCPLMKYMEINVENVSINSSIAGFVIADKSIVKNQSTTFSPSTIQIPSLGAHNIRVTNASSQTITLQLYNYPSGIKSVSIQPEKSREISWTVQQGQQASELTMTETDEKVFDFRSELTAVMARVTLK